MAAATLTIGEAVRLLLPAYGLQADILDAIAVEARNPASRLAGIRDVALHVLPNYIPDPRRRLDAGIEADLAAWTEFKAKYEVGDANLSRDFPRLPYRNIHDGKGYLVKFHEGTITFAGEYEFAIYRDGVPVLEVAAEVNYLGNGALHDFRNNCVSIAGDLYRHSNAHRPLYVLPCGLLIYEDCLTPISTFITNLETGQTVQIADAELDVYDDYGVGRDLPSDLYDAVGASTLFGRVYY